jgi:multidrug efflux pump subunit AcrB
MFLSRFAFNRQPAVFFIVAALMLFGVISYFTLPAREDPEILIRQAVVITAHPGLTADEVERLITKPLEEAAITIAEVEEINSTSQDGLSIINVEVYETYTALDDIWVRLETRINSVAPSLPEGTLRPQVISDFGDVSVMTIALFGADYPMADLYDYAQHIRDQLITVPGTKRVEILGNVAQRIFLEFDEARLLSAGLSPALIAEALTSENVLRSGPQIETPSGAYSVSPSGAFNTVDEIGRVLVRSPSSGALIALGDVLDIRSGYEDPPRQKAYFNGQEAIILAMAMHSSESVINYSRTAREAISDIASTLPAGLSFEIVTDESEKVERAVYGVTFNMLQTLAVVLGVVILFLGVRTGLIVGAIIPSVILATLAIMGMFNMPLERMSLATIVISLGLLVDNGIVVAEDFKRRLREHGDRDRALQETSSQLAFPLLYSSAVTIAVFLPLMIAQTASTEYTRSISLVVLIALSTSWVFAMTVTTTLCHRFIKAGPVDPDTAERRKRLSRAERVLARLEGGYAGILRTILRFRYAYLAGMIGVFGLGGFLMSQVSQKFFPDNDTPQILVYVDLPAGVSANATDARMRDIMALVGDAARYPDFVSSVGYVGFGGPRFVLSLAPVDPAPNVGFMVINVTNAAAADLAIPRLREDIRARFPDVNARLTRMFLGPSDTNIIQLRVTGPDPDYLNMVAGEVEDILLGLDGMFDVWSDWRNRVNRFDIVVDQAQARAAGITSADIAASLQHYGAGQVLAAVRNGDEVIPVMMRADHGQRSDLGRLETAPVFHARGGDPVPLAQVAAIEHSTGFAFIGRHNLTRSIVVEGRHISLTPEDMAPILQPSIDALNSRLAPNHSVRFDGILNDSAETNNALAATMPFILAIIILLLILQFNDIRKPLVILAALPFIIVGPAIGLLVMGADFGFMVILGLYALAGIIINNAIVLMDRFSFELAQPDRTPAEAVIAACERRFRPILMTAITTIVGLLPLIIFRDVLFFSMAVAIAFGLAIATFLVTLGLVPVLYCLFHGIRTDAEPEPSGTFEAQGALS